MVAQLIRKLAVLASAVLMAGCASATLTNAWRDPAFQAEPFRKLLVLGVSDQPGVRRAFEDEFAKALVASGVDAVAGHVLVPRDGQLAEAELRDAVAKSGVDGGLITRLVKVDRRTSVSPGYTTMMPAYGYHRSFYGYYGSSYVYQAPPVVTQYDVVVLETNLWKATQENLVWSAMTETVDPSNVKSATADYSKVIIGALREANLI